MRWSFAAVLTVALAMGGAGAAQSAERLKYFLVTGRAEFFWSLDYGSHPDSVYNGTYHARLTYNVIGIAVRDRGQLRTRQRLFVTGNGSVIDHRTIWIGDQQPRIPVPCQEDPTHETRFARRSRGSHLSLGNGLLNIDPGSAIRWAVGCAATESNAIHGLPDGKTISGAAFGIASVVACRDNFSHGSTGRPNDHSFTGAASFFVNFTPIRESQIQDARRSLRRVQGRTIRPGRPPGGSWEDCIR